MEVFRTCFETGGNAVEGWYGWYAVRDADAVTPRTLVGAAGYFGPPGDDGAVEIGYSVLPEWQRRGCAKAMVEALIEKAIRPWQAAMFPNLVEWDWDDIVQRPASEALNLFPEFASALCLM